jgi:uncharacterized protein YbjT (DUF2867 family)
MKRILITGASGYVGGRLVSALHKSGYTIRCFVRRPELLKERLPDACEAFKGDMKDVGSIQSALESVEAAYYLVHSMGSKHGFEAQDRTYAANFLRAAEAAGLKRIIYLGGLGGSKDLSPHLASRQEVGKILRCGKVPTLEFRAGIIIGSGSLSFEILRALVDRLPIMTTPRWVRTLTQPISIQDVLAYLQEGLGVELTQSEVYEIGGPDRVSYGELMLEYARQKGLRRLILPVPVLTPGLSSKWLGLVTPVHARVGRYLIEGLRSETTVQDSKAGKVFQVRPRGVTEAVAQAVQNKD